MDRYVLGFAFFDHKYPGDNDGVLLMRKARPDWQAGKLNGVGGRIEEGEDPQDAMVREFKEETGVDTECREWNFFAVLSGVDYEVFCFSSTIPNSRLAHAYNPDATEPLVRAKTSRLSNVVYKLKYLIPLSRDPRIGLVHIKDLADAPSLTRTEKVSAKPAA